MAKSEVHGTPSGAETTPAERPSDDALRAFAAFHTKLAAATAMREQAHREGPAALVRLINIATDAWGESQSRVVANILLSCYNGDRFRVDLTDFRLLDIDVFQDCLTVLRMDFSPKQEVHCYFQNGGDIFEKLAKDWRIPDHAKRGRA